MRKSVTTCQPQRLQRTCALLLGVLCALSALAPSARAQQNDNTAQTNKPRTTKNIAGMSSSDAPGGSKVTITSDGVLNDYSAYRSGDRFYVVIPQASAKGVGGVRGRGFEGAQVQRRGQDVVLSFKLQPGASARVDQRFNRLVVQFNASDVGAQPKNTNQPTQQPTPEPRAQVRTPVELASTPTPTPNTRPTPDARTQNQTTANQTTGVLPPGGVPTPLVAPSPLPQTTPQLASPSPTVETAVTPTPEQLAQLQTTPAGPTSSTTTNAPSTAAPVSLGTTVLRNWPWLLLALVALGGLVLFVFARGGERREQLPPAAPATEPTALRDTPKVALPAKEPVVAAVVPPAPVVPAPVVATPVVAAESRKNRKDKRGKKGQKGQKQQPHTVAPALVAPAPPVGAEPADADVTVESAPVEAGATTAAAVIVAAGAAALASEDAPPADTSERVAEEVKKLVAGAAYDEALIGASDVATRQVVAAELMTALATETEDVRGERARVAFQQHGYFADAARDLRAAEAPAQRASAARTLGMVGDKTATPHLVAALEDPAPEVRRSAVEALAELQDPAAVGPLEALRWRETSDQIPRKLLLNAIEASAAAAVIDALVESPAVKTPTETTDAEAATIVAAPAAEAVSVEAAHVDEVAAVAAPVDESEAETAELPPVFVPEPELEAEPTVAAAPVVAPEETSVESPVEIVAEESAASVPAVVVEPPVEAVEVESPAVIEHADVTAASADVAESLPPLALDVESFAPAAPEQLVEPAAVDDVTRESAPLTEATTSTPVADDLSRTIESILSAPPAPVEAETKDIDLFMPASGAADLDEWVDVDVEERSADTTAPPATVLEQRVSFDAEVEEHAPAAWTRPVDTRADETTKEIEPQLFTPVEEAATEVESPFILDEPTVITSPQTTAKEIDLLGAEEERLSIIPKAIQLRLESEDVSERAASVLALARLNTDEAFHQICAAFDDSALEVRQAAARALYSLADDRADSFTRALREAPAERRRRIGTAISASGLADEAVSNLTGESRDKTYDAFSLLFLMAKAGETTPLIHAIETHPDNEVRLAVVKLLALSGQHEILPSFRRLAVRGSLPTEVRSAVMEAIYQISSQPQHTT